jgi:cytochrome c oxidase subunit 2
VVGGILLIADFPGPAWPKALPFHGVGRDRGSGKTDEGGVSLRNGLRNLASAVVAGIGLVALAGRALAMEVTQPQPWQINLQPAGSPIMEAIHRFSNGVLVIITLIVIFVLALLLYVMLRFNARANPVPSRTSHNTLIEVLWTIVPILILVGIAIPSFSLLFSEHDPARMIPNYDPAKAVTVKATGSQWSWNYDYPDNGDVSFDSAMLQENQRTDKANQPRLLAVDNPMVVPVGSVIRMQVIGNDVIHSFAVPALGVKLDAVPGRLNEIWFMAEREGIYYGQCSQLCGQSPSDDPNDLHGHSFMPIEVMAVAPDKFTAWAAAAKKDLPGAYKLLAESDGRDAPVKVAGK